MLHVDIIDGSFSPDMPLGIGTVKQLCKYTDMIFVCATLLRGAAYCAHPVDDRILIDPNRFIPTIEQGRHSFAFRLSYDKAELMENNAQEFANTPFSLNFFPRGTGDLAKKVLFIENPAISLSAFYKNEDRYILRLVNNNPASNSTILTLIDATCQIAFEAYEVKTFIYNNGALSQMDIWL